jgi:hypothetical protein
MRIQTKQSGRTKLYGAKHCGRTRPYSAQRRHPTIHSGVTESNDVAHYSTKRRDEVQQRRIQRRHATGRDMAAALGEILRSGRTELYSAQRQNSAVWTSTQRRSKTSMERDRAATPNPTHPLRDIAATQYRSEHGGKTALHLTQRHYPTEQNREATPYKTRPSGTSTQHRTSPDAAAVRCRTLRGGTAKHNSTQRRDTTRLCKTGRPNLAFRNASERSGHTTQIRTKRQDDTQRFMARPDRAALRNETR